MTRGRKPGGTKTGGRKKGTPNKATQSFRNTLDSLGFDVAEEAVKLFKTEMPIDQRLKLLDLIASYSHQKPKPAEVVPPPAAPQPTSKPVLTLVQRSELTQLLKKQDDPPDPNPPPAG